MNNVSIIITTKNEAVNIANCLKSIKQQSYLNIEIIVVDNNSTDGTKKIAENYTDKVFNKGPERSAQRNFGAKKAKGKYLLFLDADMVLERQVIEDCVKILADNKSVKAVIIPEKSYGNSFWARVKAFEKSFYVDNNDVEAARFYYKNIFIQQNGFDEKITGPEDWELSQRVSRIYPIARVKSYILHNEGNLSLIKTMKKKYYYAVNFDIYQNSMIEKNVSTKKMIVFHRYKLYFSNPHKLFFNPVLGLAMLFMKTCEFAAGVIGYMMKTYSGGKK
jgi:glycosyltransferase involved in cell wall biosynthesis